MSSHLTKQQLMELAKTGPIPLVMKLWLTYDGLQAPEQVKVQISKEIWPKSNEEFEAIVIERPNGGIITLPEVCFDDEGKGHFARHRIWLFETIEQMESTAMSCPFCDSPDAGQLTDEFYTLPGSIFECGTTHLPDGSYTRSEACVELEEEQQNYSE